MFKTPFVLLLTLCLYLGQIQAEPVGKIDLGPAFAHIDILESGKTVKRMDMWAIRGDFAYRIFRGLYIKPMFIYGNGGAARGGIFTGAVGLGVTLPCRNYLKIVDTYDLDIVVVPTVGVNYCHVWTKIDIPQVALKNRRENFKSWAPYVALEVYYAFRPQWRFNVSVQYSWARTDTTIQSVGKSKNRSEGFTYSALLEHDFCDDWSVNLGAAYNLSLTKEKHGLRGTGIKLGIAHWF